MTADVEEVPFPKIPLLSEANETVTPATGFPQPSLTVAVTRPAEAAEVFPLWFDSGDFCRRLSRE